MSFFRGLALTLTCSITLDGAVDTSVTVQGRWTRNRTELANETEVINGTVTGRIRISVVNLAMTTPPYQTSVRFNLLNNDTDTGLYE